MPMLMTKLNTQGFAADAALHYFETPSAAAVCQAS